MALAIVVSILFWVGVLGWAVPTFGVMPTIVGYGVSLVLVAIVAGIARHHVRVAPPRRASWTPSTEHRNHQRAGRPRAA